MKKEALDDLIMFMGKGKGAKKGGEEDVLKKEVILEVERSLEKVKGDEIKDQEEMAKRPFTDPKEERAKKSTPHPR